MTATDRLPNAEFRPGATARCILIPEVDTGGEQLPLRIGEHPVGLSVSLELFDLVFHPFSLSR